MTDVREEMKARNLVGTAGMSVFRRVLLGEAVQIKMRNAHNPEITETGH